MTTTSPLPCPICGESPVQDEVCPGSCGSLEGLDLRRQQEIPKQRRLFGYDWAQGYVAPWLGVDTAAVADALKTAHMTAADTLMDLGCGDGRICRVAAEQFGAKAVGVDLDASLLQEARHANSEFVANQQVSFHQQDLFTVDVLQFSVITVFLLPESLERLAPRLRTVLARGSRVVTWGWKIPKLGQEPACQHDTDDREIFSSSEDYNGLLSSWFLYSGPNDPP